MTVHSCPSSAIGVPPTLAVAGVGGPVTGSMCTGYGGLDLAVLAVLGGRVGWCADPDRHVRAILAARMPGVANLGDLTTVDWARVPRVDVVTAGFPCQDLSSAGNGAGITEGTRSGLWISIATAVRHLRPRLVFLENVDALRWRHPGLDRVLGDLADAGYDASWRSVRASDVGAPHARKRLFVLAHLAVAADTAADSGRGGGSVADAVGLGRPPGLAGVLPASARLPGPAVRRADQPDHHPTRRLTLAPAETVDRAPRAAVAGGGWRVEWGHYEPAIRRWEHMMGRPVPRPTETTPSGRLGSSARCLEWLMGLPAGWVTDIPIRRSAQITALGNGVVPAQAALALRLLLAEHPHAPRPGLELRAALHPETGTATSDRSAA